MKKALNYHPYHYKLITFIFDTFHFRLFKQHWKTCTVKKFPNSPIAFFRVIIELKKNRRRVQPSIITKIYRGRGYLSIPCLGFRKKYLWYKKITIAKKFDVFTLNYLHNMTDKIRLLQTFEIEGGDHNINILYVRGVTVPIIRKCIYQIKEYTFYFY